MVLAVGGLVVGEPVVVSAGGLVGAAAASAVGLVVRSGGLEVVGLDSEDSLGTADSLDSDDSLDLDESLDVDD